MKLLSRSLAKADFAAGTVATIGNFDGVHRGHQALLVRLHQQSLARGLPSVVILFEPQPREFFSRDSSQARLSTLREKLVLFQQFNIDYVYCLRFNHSLANMDAEIFAHHYFFTLLNVRYLLVGKDFQFGKQRGGNVDLLHRLAKSKHCEVDIFTDFEVGALRVSSTLIRQALKQGQLQQASELLGRTYNICGRVYQEKKFTIFPFKILKLFSQRRNLPLGGVFCIRIIRQDKQIINGVAYLEAIQVSKNAKNNIMINLFDFEKPLLGERVTIFFLHNMRDGFDFSARMLQATQLHEDMKAAEILFKNNCLELNVL